jgi:glycosyltransferase involved in cell wall biosynthesis
LKILHVVPTYLPATRYGGPIYSVHGLCKALAACGHDVHVMTTSVDGPGDSDVPLGVGVDLDGVKVHYYPSRRLRRLYWSPSMRRALASKIGDFDIVHTHAIYLWPSIAAGRAARRAGVPYVISPRGMMVKEMVRRKSRIVKTMWMRLFDRGMVERAAAVHVTSSRESREADRFGWRLPPRIVLPNGVDEPAPLTRRTPSETAAPQILFLGRVNWEKGLDRLVPALTHVPGVRLVIAGNDEGNYREVVERLAHECGVAERVSFAGHVGGADKETLFDRSALLVLPSYSENFGNVVLEAMARGCPVVVTPDVGAAEVVEQSGAGVVADGDPDVLGPAISTLVANPTRLAEMSRAGYRAVVERYTWNAVAEAMARRYAELTG